jgi:hypothetical protein
LNVQHIEGASGESQKYLTVQLYVGLWHAVSLFGQWERATMSSSYQYSRLESPEHVRLIHVNPGTKGTTMTCEIHRACLPDSPVYEALLYMWDLDGRAGQPAEYYCILCGEFQTPIPPNLFSALQNLRKDAEDLVPCVDAVCIN